MDPARINRALARLASDIAEENHGIEEFYLPRLHQARGQEDWS